MRSSTLNHLNEGLKENSEAIRRGGGWVADGRGRLRRPLVPNANESREQRRATIIPKNGKPEKKRQKLNESMLHGVTCGRGPGGNLNFAIDRGQVAIDGTRTDNQLPGYLRIG